jgi:hypothetical protein
MFVIAIVWLYFALLFSIGLWPNVPAMVGTFVLAGIVPAALLLHNLRSPATGRIRSRQRARRDAQLVQQQMGGPDDGDADEDQH